MKPDEKPNARPCPQDCGKCSSWQQVYCCTKMTFNLSKVTNEARAEIAALRSEIAELRSTLPEKADELSTPTTQE